MKSFLIKPGKAFHLKDWKPFDTSACPEGKEKSEKKLHDLQKELGELQHLLYAEHTHRVLIILQGMDTSGKDGTIRLVFEDVNPQGVRVAPFGVPTKNELDHDYLWRVHQQTPAKGEIVIFNRSHYEDVLTVRVHNIISKEVCKKRYKQINDFERLLSEEGTTILKFFLHISPDEQKKRLQARVDDPAKRWKFNENDLKERKLWPKYMEAYHDALAHTSTDWAPWYIVPADAKWHRNLIVASTIVDALKGLNMRFPKPQFDPASIRIA